MEDDIPSYSRRDMRVWLCSACREWYLAPATVARPLCPRCRTPPTALACTRCGHTWVPRFDEPPERCPKCNSPYWNRLRTVGSKPKEEVL